MMCTVTSSSRSVPSPAAAPATSGRCRCRTRLRTCGGSVVIRWVHSDCNTALQEHACGTRRRPVIRCPAARVPVTLAARLCTVLLHPTVGAGRTECLVEPTLKLPMFTRRGFGGQQEQTAHRGGRRPVDWFARDDPQMHAAWSRAGRTQGPTSRIRGYCGGYGCAAGLPPSPGSCG